MYRVNSLYDVYIGSRSLQPNVRPSGDAHNQSGYGRKKLPQPLGVNEKMDCCRLILSSILLLHLHATTYMAEGKLIIIITIIKP